jgi:hypothetical protein
MANLICHRSSKPNELRKHIKEKHLRVMDNVCTLCPFKSSWSAALYNHMASVHGAGKTHECEVCGYKTGRRDMLNVHIR